MLFLFGEVSFYYCCLGWAALLWHSLGLPYNYLEIYDKNRKNKHKLILIVLKIEKYQTLKMISTNQNNQLNACPTSVTEGEVARVKLV